MRNLNLALVPICLWAIASSAGQPGQASQLNKTRAVTKLPFCALVLREWKNPVALGFDDYVIMEGDRMTEGNLRLLFKVLSDQHSDEQNFQAWVYTDVTQLASIATQSGHSGEDDTLKNHKWAHYFRSPEREYFEFKQKASENELSKIVLREDR